jgi:L-methionine (R)-S-oxide reductase
VVSRILHRGQIDISLIGYIGFYIESSLFPPPRISRIDPSAADAPISRKMLLGPFCGKPACQFINITPGKSRGVCADAFLQRKTVIVLDVEQYPGHIACDGDTKSEIVCPLILRPNNSNAVTLGVLDIDCLVEGGFDEEDRKGLEKIVELVVESCDW